MSAEPSTSKLNEQNTRNNESSVHKQQTLHSFFSTNEKATENSEENSNKSRKTPGKFSSLVKVVIGIILRNNQSK